jgi:hypothetical protein
MQILQQHQCIAAGGANWACHAHGKGSLHERSTALGQRDDEARAD